MGTFSSLETLITSLRVQSLAQQLVTNNITNAATKGFSRRLPVLSPAATVAVPRLNSAFGPGQVGSGVAFGELKRIRDEFLDIQDRGERSVRGQRTALYGAVEGMRVLFPEASNPAARGLATMVGVFFNDFTALAAAPASGVARAKLAGDATTLATQFNAAARTLQSLREETDARIRDGLTRVNELLGRIAGANAEIIRGGAPAADFQDQRDLALDELAEYLRVDVVTMADGSAMVLTGNARVLVQGATAARLEAVPTPHEPRFAGIGLRGPGAASAADITGEVTTGKLGGWLDARDRVLGEEHLELDELASSLIARVNLLHRAGYGSDGVTTNLDFFQGDRALNLTVNAALTSAAGQANIAASRLNGNGANGDQAATIGLLKGMLMNATIQSDVFVNNGADPVDPTQPLASTTHTALNGANPFATNQADWLTPPTAAGTLMINGTAIAWANTDSIDAIVQRINAAFGGTVRASFDYTAQKVSLVSSMPLTVSDAAGNLADAWHLQTRVDSLAPVNNGGGPGELGRRVDAFGTDPAPYTSEGWTFALSASAMNYRTPAGAGGTLVANGVAVAWTAGQDMATITGNVNAALAGAGVPLFAGFDPATQRFFFQGNQAAPGGSRDPLALGDAAGNLGFVMNLEAQPAFGAFADALLAQFQAQAEDAGALKDQAEAAVTQLDGQRDAISKVDVDQEKAQLLEFVRAYEAAVRAIAAMDETLNTLINRMAASSFAGGPTSSVLTS